MSIQNCRECGRNVDTDWENMEDGLCKECQERYSKPGVETFKY